MFKSFLYSLRYMILIIIFYYIFQLKMIYVPSILIIAIVPVNFLAIHYGILYQIKKDNYVTKYYILMSLVFFTTLFNVIFLSLNNVNFFVIVFTLFINTLELIYLDLPASSNIKIKKENINRKPKNIEPDEKNIIEFSNTKKR